jgi:peptide/nickel transport system permease protein
MIKSLVKSIGIFLGVSLLVFLLFNLSGNDPVRNVLGENTHAEIIENTRKKWNLDLSLTEQYFLFLNGMSPISFHSSDESSRWAWQESFQGTKFEFGDWALGLKWPFLGKSYINDQNVSEVLFSVLPATLLLATVSILLSLIIGVMLGIVAAKYENTIWDKMLISISSLGMSAPSFFMAIVLAWLLAVQWGAFTGLPLTGSLYDLDPWTGRHIEWRNIVLPVITLMIRPLGVVVQLMRSSLLEVYQQDFIRTARAKGLSESRILWVHAVPNSMNAVLTAISGWFASLLAGALFVEFVFGWRGMGQVMFQAIEKGDLPILMGGVITIALIFMVIDILMNRFYKVLDPRL